MTELSNIFCGTVHVQGPYGNVQRLLEEVYDPRLVEIPGQYMLVAQTVQSRKNFASATTTLQALAHLQGLEKELRGLLSIPEDAACVTKLIQSSSYAGMICSFVHKALYLQAVAQGVQCLGFLYILSVDTRFKKCTAQFMQRFCQVGEVVRLLRPHLLQLTLQTLPLCNNLTWAAGSEKQPGSQLLTKTSDIQSIGEIGEVLHSYGHSSSAQNLRPSD